MSKKQPPEPRDLGRMLRGYVRFREEAALSIYCAYLARTQPPLLPGDRDTLMDMAIWDAERLAAKLEAADQSRPDHPARREGA